MMRNKIKSVEIKGFKSIRDQCVELGDLNVLIGANGSGKSNLVSYFRLYNSIISAHLQFDVASEMGGANAIFYYGAKKTPQIESKITLKTKEGLNTHCMKLLHAADNTLVIKKEWLSYPPEDNATEPQEIPIASGLKESGLTSFESMTRPQDQHIQNLMRNLRVYQFQDTSKTAKIKMANYIHDTDQINNDAGNLAAILYVLKETKEKYYKRIVSIIQQVAPFFGDFEVSPLKISPTTNMLNWREKDSGELFGPHQLSDGTLRFMALVTLLMQPPEDLPAVVIIDEPELGLHPFAIETLSGLIQGASRKCQIIISTQSVELLNFMDPKDIVVVDRPDKESIFTRLDEDKLKEWLKDYSLGELWKKNVLGGRPA